MIETLSLTDLVENTLPAQSIGAQFLPENNNSVFLKATSASTATLVDADSKPVAFGAALKCNSKQIYCMIGNVEEKVTKKSLWVEKVPSDDKFNSIMKITKEVPLIDYSGETLFEQTFANKQEKPAILHIVDALISNTIGCDGMDISKNVTVDVESNEEVAQWRDTIGTVVSDKVLFEKLSVNRFELLALASDITIEELNENNKIAVLDYDSELTTYDREEYLQALFGISGVKGKVAMSNGLANGYILTMDNRILQCYGEDEATQRALLAAAATDMTTSQVVLSVRLDSNDTISQLTQNALTRTRITRLHSRTVVTNIKWNKIASPNLGLHLF